MVNVSLNILKQYGRAKYSQCGMGGGGLVLVICLEVSWNTEVVPRNVELLRQT